MSQFILLMIAILNILQKYFMLQLNKSPPIFFFQTINIADEQMLHFCLCVTPYLECFKFRLTPHLFKAFTHLNIRSTV